MIFVICLIVLLELSCLCWLWPSCSVSSNWVLFHVSRLCPFWTVPSNWYFVSFGLSCLSRLWPFGTVSLNSHYVFILVVLCPFCFSLLHISPGLLLFSLELIFYFRLVLFRLFGLYPFCTASSYYFFQPFFSIYFYT